MTTQDPALLFGSFLTPSAERPDRVVAPARLSEQADPRPVTFQDHRFGFYSGQV
jgi:hypothetical protein